MARNDQSEAALQYHEGTKHPNGRLMDPHHRYTGQRPHLFKEYEGGARVPLPLDQSPGQMSALQAIASDSSGDGGETTPDLRALARLLYFSAGITKRIDYGPPVGTIPFRAASCTGALYHIELYVVCGDLARLPAGVYHFDPQEAALTRLRSGDLRGVLVEATGNSKAIRQAPLTLIYSDVYWRNAIKYQAREYRHAFWDSGTILSHTMAQAAAEGLPARVKLGFVDAAVNELLGLDTGEEFALALVPVGRGPDAPPPGDLPPLEAQATIHWPRRIQPILDMHAASSLAGGAQAAEWRWQMASLPLPSPQRELTELPEVDVEAQEGDALEEVILRRGSSRRFERRPIALQQLAAMLRQSTRGIASDFSSTSGPALNHLYVIATAIERLTPGAYVYHPERHALELIREIPQKQLRREAGYLALGQDLGADAAANIYFLTDLEEILPTLGNRGYRAAQMEASIMAGRVYLAAYAQRVGATGLTFYDDAVMEFFAPHGEGKEVMFLMAVGGD